MRKERKEMGEMSPPSERKGDGGIGKRREKHKNGNTPSHDGTFPHRTY